MSPSRHEQVMREIHKELGRKPKNPKELTTVLAKLKDSMYVSLSSIYKIWDEYGFSNESRKHAIALLKIIKHKPNPKHVEDLIETALYKRVNCPLKTLKEAATELWGLEHMDGISDPNLIKDLENLVRFKVYLKLATENPDKPLAGIKSRLFKPTPSRTRIESLVNKMKELAESSEFQHLRDALNEIETLREKAKKVRGDWW